MPFFEPEQAAVEDQLAGLGRELFVPFEVIKLRNASVIWRNDRWLRSRGIEIDDNNISRAVDKWLLGDFAYAAATRVDPLDSFEDGRREVHADRYGLTNGSLHGGSGRTGIFGHFNVKGVGKTPLVSDAGDPAHSNGMMYLWEALLEAICSETAHPELPFGCIPVVAIIDMGFSTATGKDLPSRRRALLIRPNFVRPAHLERSIYFGQGGSEASEQFQDAVRVKRAIRQLLIVRQESSDVFLTKMISRDAEQIGAAQAQRFWLHRFASSNRSIEGALVDFGAFRSLPNWKRVNSPTEAFGLESESLLATAHSLNHYIMKYANPSRKITPSEIGSEINRGIEKGFTRACASAMLAENAAHCKDAVDILRHYYSKQQKSLVDVADRSARRQAWLLDEIAPGWRPQRGSSDEERSIAGELMLSIGRSCFEKYEFEAKLNSLARWLTPRSALYRWTMVLRIPRFVSSLTGDSMSDRMRTAEFVDRQVSRSRRVWPGMSTRMSVKAQICMSGSAALYGMNCKTGREGVLVFGQKSSENFIALGRAFPIDSDAFVSAPGDHGMQIWIDQEHNGGEESTLCRILARARIVRGQAYSYPF